MLMLRRVQGNSMLPALRPGQLVLARTHVGELQVGDVVIIRHGGLEKIKRISDMNGGSVCVVGDNAAESTDSRHFGWIDRSAVRAKLVVVLP